MVIAVHVVSAQQALCHRLYLLEYLLQLLKVPLVLVHLEAQGIDASRRELFSAL